MNEIDEDVIRQAIARLHHIANVSGCDLDEECPHGVPCDVAGPLAAILLEHLDAGTIYPGDWALAVAVTRREVAS